MIVEFHVDGAFLRHTAESLSDAAVRIQRLHTDNGSCRAVTWIGPGSQSAIDSALEGDDSVGAAAHVATETDGHWYAIHTDDPSLAAISRALLDANGFLTGAAQTGGEWNVRARFPEKSAVLAFRDDLVADGLEIDVRTITGDTDDAAQFGVTDPQREVLLLALNRGYFTVPRDASLSDLAADLGISSQAASERLRRGTRTLVENTLASPEQPLVGSAPE